ncbi:MAG TPA: helix-turn-helix transcriptional regulator [Bacteroidia bacterium]|nr:helix-turn-helix transcriptional regulator [Bacteroidia bacterium]
MAKKSSYEKASKEIGEKLKALRISKKYTSYENFALENNIDRKQYWRIENGHNLTLKSLIKILDIHKITLKEFFSKHFDN